MKSLIAIATLLSGLSAQAAVTQIGSVYFQAASAFVPANQVCREGKFLVKKDGQPVRVEIITGNNQKSGYNIYKDAKQPVVSVANRCAEARTSDNFKGGACEVWETYTLDQSKVSVTSFASRKDLEDGRGGTIIGSYTIPACAK